MYPYGVFAPRSSDVHIDLGYLKLILNSYSNLQRPCKTKISFAPSLGKMSIGHGLPSRACSSIRSISTSAACQRNCGLRRPQTHGLPSISQRNTKHHLCLPLAQRTNWNVHPASRVGFDKKLNANIG